VALALQIENPELSSKLAAPKYSEFLKDMARKDSSFAAIVHDKLYDLVKLAKESKQKSRSYSFDCMNRDKREFVHELSDHFGVDSESYDSEPKRNVVVTAVRERVWLPSQSILDVIQGLRKAPAPVNIKATQP
jgi:transcriptional repressor NF-X1